MVKSEKRKKSKDIYRLTDYELDLLDRATKRVLFKFKSCMLYDNVSSGKKLELLYYIEQILDEYEENNM